MIGVLHILSHGQRPGGSQDGKGRIIPAGNRLPTGNELRQTGQLADAERRLKISQSIIEAQIHLLVEPGVRPVRQRTIQGNAMLAKLAHPPCKSRVVGRDHPAFARGDRFGRMQAERRKIGQRSNRLAMIGSARLWQASLTSARPCRAGNPRKARVVAWLPA